MNFSTRTLALSETRQFSNLFLDYVNEVAALAPFYTYSPTEDGLVKAASANNYHEAHRIVLADVIKRQYETSGTTLPADLHTKLAVTGTLTVCTGHQLVLLGGPLFFVYKILTAIKTAALLEKRLQCAVVPVFWMAGEDHDIDEIRSVQLFGKTLSWDETGGGPVGRLRTDSLQPFLAELAQILGTAPGAAEMAQTMQQIYAPGSSLTDATRRFVHYLFGGKVLCLDPDEAALKHLFLPQLRAELESGIGLQPLSQSIAALEAAGYEAQVNPRPVNLFYITDTTRERIDRHGENFILANSNREIERTALLAELEQQPQNFSPNVVLRPLYQQHILPNIAYIGGPGELAYWLEYRTMFEAQQIAFPVLLPRAFMLVLDNGTASKLAKLNVDVTELFLPADELVKNYIKRTAGSQISFEAEQEALQQLFAGITSKATATDATLRGAAESTLQQMKNSLAALESKVVRAAKQREETSIDQLRKLRDKILPGNVLQERSDNILPLLLRYGHEFVQALETQIMPGVHQFTVLTAQ
jgi:bacillithiol biosynthesis cysteine-adding enzyme BshC